MKKILSGFFCFISIVVAAQTASLSLIGKDKAIDPYKYSIVKDGMFDKASVVSAHPLASMVGAVIMKNGGNAFDAAIATQLTLAVVYPRAGNIGGGGFLAGRKKDGELVGIDYRETAPAKAFRDMYLDKEGNAQLKLSQNGHLAAGIPGTIAGIFATLPYAKLSFRQLIQPAIDIAEFGFVITERDANSFNSNQEAFKKNNTRVPVFVQQKKWKAGDTLVQKELAKTLRRIRDKGQKGFYEGETADLIVAEMKKANGIITHADLKNYKAKKRTLLQFTYKGHDIIGFPPPSSGGILLLQMMKMIEERNIGVMGFQTAKSVQLMVEAERRAFADRATHLGDPDFWKVPLKTITSKAYLQKRMQDYDSTKATHSNTIEAGIVHESDETTHLSVMDEEGNMVGITTTLNGNYGCKTVVSGAGFFLNNEMDDFSIKAGTPNMFGAVGGKANAIEPGKRMLSSMTPTLVLKNKQPYIVIGTPGGTTIPTSVLQGLINIIEFGMSASDAINKPKFHHQWMPDVIEVEKDFSMEVRKQLEVMGYSIKERTFGSTEIIRRIKGKLEAAADKRGDDSVAGF